MNYLNWCLEITLPEGASVQQSESSTICNRHLLDKKCKENLEHIMPPGCATCSKPVFLVLSSYKEPLQVVPLLVRRIIAPSSSVILLLKVAPSVMGIFWMKKVKKIWNILCHLDVQYVQNKSFYYSHLTKNLYRLCHFWLEE